MRTRWFLAGAVSAGLATLVSSSGFWWILALAIILSWASCGV